MTVGKMKKQLILEAAARSFRDKGYSATSMRDLALAVDLKASSLYNHIGSKQEILREICFDNANHFLSGMEAIERMNTGALEKIKSLIHLHIQVATEDITSVTAFNDEWRHLQEPELSEFVTLRRNYENRFKTIIEKGIQEGSLIPVEPIVALYTILSSMRWLYDWYKPERKLSLEVIREQIISLLLRGICRQL